MLGHAVGPVGCYTVDSAMDVIMVSLRRVAKAAEEREVDLGLEVLHPMDITTWSMVRTIHQGLDIIEEIDSPRLGLMLDLYNTWWDPEIKSGIVRAGNRIKGVHLADWRNPTRSFTDRTIPGQGIIPWPIDPRVGSGGKVSTMWRYSTSCGVRLRSDAG